MAFVYPESNQTTTQDISPSMVILGMLCFLVSLEAFHDMYRTVWGLHRIGPEGVTWKFQHSLFKRAVAPFIGHTVLLFPLVFTFLLHSRGLQFTDLIDTMSFAYHELLIYHITLVVVNFVSGVFMVPYVHFSLKLGLFGKEDRTLGYMITKFFSIPFVVSTIILCIEMIYSVAYLNTNSGAIVFTILYLLTSVPVIRFLWMFIFRGSQDYTARWLIAMRSACVIHLGVLYMSGWVILMMLVLEGTGADGFWRSVANLTDKRSKVVFLHFSMYLILLATVGARVFLAKLRKRGRAAKILVAATGEQIPEVAKERAERERARTGAKKDDSLTITGVFAGLDRLVSGDGSTKNLHARPANGPSLDGSNAGLLPAGEKEESSSAPAAENGSV